MKHVLLFILLALANKSTAQIPNPGFENWGVVPGTFVMYPSEWNTLEWTSPCQSTEACEGDYALMVSAWYAYLATRVIQPFPINSRPASFRGCYKYTDNMVRASGSAPIETDTALVAAILTKWNAATSDRDTIGYGRLQLNQSLSFTSFACAISYTDASVPDTVTIVLDPTLVRRYPDRFYVAHNMAECSFFTTDDLSLSDVPVGVGGLENDHDLQVYPNPVNDILTIAAKNDVKKLIISDIYGKTVLQAETAGIDIKLDLGSLSSGVYLLKCIDKEGSPFAVKKLVKQ